MKKFVIGLDLGLACTGYAEMWVSGEIAKGKSTPYNPGTASIRAGKRRSGQRLSWIVQRLMDHGAPGADLAVVEGYSYSSATSKAHKIGELGGAVRYALYEWDVPYIVVPPKTMKKLVTGNGNADKVQVMQAIHHLTGYEPQNHDEADALSLAYLGSLGVLDGQR